MRKENSNRRADFVLRGYEVQKNHMLCIVYVHIYRGMKMMNFDREICGMARRDLRSTWKTPFFLPESPTPFPFSSSKSLINGTKMMIILFEKFSFRSKDWSILVLRQNNSGYYLLFWSLLSKTVSMKTRTIFLTTLIKLILCENIFKYSAREY